MTNTYWNAEVYDRIGTPMRGWAQQVIDDLQRVLVEGRSKKSAAELSGRTANNRIVNFPGPQRLANTYADVRVTAALHHSLRGELLNAR